MRSAALFVHYTVLWIFPEIALGDGPKKRQFFRCHQETYAPFRRTYASKSPLPAHSRAMNTLWLIVIISYVWTIFGCVIFRIMSNSLGRNFSRKSFGAVFLLMTKILGYFRYKIIQFCSKSIIFDAKSPKIKKMIIFRPKSHEKSTKNANFWFKHFKIFIQNLILPLIAMCLLALSPGFCQVQCFTLLYVPSPSSAPSVKPCLANTASSFADRRDIRLGQFQNNWHFANEKISFSDFAF